MEYSETTPENRDEKQASYHRHAVARALVSASVFGTLGALFGRWMGRHGNDPTSKLAEPITKWSMGIFCGTLAAYSSFKASERIEKEEARECVRENADKNAMAPRDAKAPDPSGDVPATTAHSTSATNEGTVVQAASQVVLEK